MLSILLTMLACQSNLDTTSDQLGENWELEFGRAEFVESSIPTVTVFANLSEIQVGDLVITEVMHTPQQTPYDSYGEWIELYNTSDVSIDLNGLELSSSNDSGVTFSNSFVVQSGEYVLLGTRSTLNGGLTFDGLYSAGSIRLGINDDLSIGYDGVTFDTISWHRYLDAVTDGRSFSLDGDDLDATINDSEYRWYAGQTTYGEGDYGTPGSANLSVYMGNELATGDLVITEIMHNPTMVWDSRGEWFEVQNRTDGIVQLYGLSLSSDGDIGFTADTNSWLPIDDFAVFAPRADDTENGGVTVDEVYYFSDFWLGQTDSITLSSNQGIVDTVSYDRWTWGQYDGVSINLSPVATDATDNDTAQFWCEATNTYGDGDLGTPGLPNRDCPNIDYDGDGYTIEEGDCNDESEYALPIGGIEVCDDIDNDCDGFIDDDDDSVLYGESDSWYLDIDGDGYGGLYSVPIIQCDTPIGGMNNAYVDNYDDCDDLDPNSTTTLVDEDCDGVLNDPGVHLFILTGQSNMANIDPMDTFIPTLESTLEENSFEVIQYAMGGRSIGYWDQDFPYPEDLVTSPGVMMPVLFRRAELALGERPLRRATLVWMQGEADAQQSYSNIYEDCFDRVLLDFQTELGLDTMDIVVGRISDSDNPSDEWNNMRALLENIGNRDGAAWVSTDDLNNYVDPQTGTIQNTLHYTEEGYLTLGERFANAALSLLE